jgi:hypothetical protein
MVILGTLWQLYATERLQLLEKNFYQKFFSKCIFDKKFFQ